MPKPFQFDIQVESRRISLRSYAKINIGLHILGRREDGYHEIRTIFQTVNLYDRLEIALIRGQEIEFTSDDRGLDPRHNLVVRAILSLSRLKKLDKGYRVHLEKRIPVGAGLGGGSSNAAAAIHGIQCGLRRQHRYCGSGAGATEIIDDDFGGGLSGNLERNLEIELAAE